MSRTVTHRGPPARLEAIVRDALPSISRRTARRLIADGEVTLNARWATKGASVRDGDRITLPTLAPLAAEPTLAARVVHVDAALAVLDKPAGMPTLPLAASERGTLAGFALGIYPECAGIGGPLTAGIAHRLDSGSSGLVLVARSQALWDELRGAFRQRCVRKRYLAVVTGSPRPGTIDLPLAHDPRDRRRMIAARDDLRSWPARTRIECLASRPPYTLVCATIRTGVTHQVRVHLATHGTPVVGDLLYGGLAHPVIAGRHALHAAELALPPLQHHGGGRFGAPLPDDLLVLL